MHVYLNGHYIAARDASISPLDRGFLFGDGIYEVVRAIDGRLVEPHRHWTRLARSLRETRIDRPLTLGDDEVSTIALRLLEENGLMQGHAIVYLEVTRGSVSPRTHHFPPAGTPPTVFASAAAFTPFDGQRVTGVPVILAPDERWARCDIKSVNLLPNAMAKQLAVDAGAWETVFVRDGTITEGTSSNFFAVIAGELRTHPATHAILGGVTRDVTLAVAKTLGIGIAERAFTVAELEGAEEAFLTSTTNDVMPVVRVDGARIGSGEPGAVTRRIGEEVRKRLFD
ncbi:MAG TPA: aminotransferase class IV [Gemmatimonadaceae bacterium]|nr:aminotransferase class IV [Gemmatimonadaceae bacterium]